MNEVDNKSCFNCELAIILCDELLGCRLISSCTQIILVHGNKYPKWKERLNNV